MAIDSHATDLISLYDRAKLHNIEILNMIKNHYSYTNSEIAEKLLSDWDVARKLFVKVMPIEYKNALKKIKEQKIAELMNK